MNKIIKHILCVGAAIPIAAMLHLISWLWFNLIITVYYIDFISTPYMILPLTLVCAPVILASYGLLHFFVLRKKLYFSYTISLTIVGCILSRLHLVFLDKRYFYDNLVFDPIIRVVFPNLRFDMGYEIFFWFLLYLMPMVCLGIILLLDLILTIIKKQRINTKLQPSV